ncbi:translation initiation factor IF-2-like [Equus quagga]|uniref:translation initiation factor IF-2-like n=1 Tax=Equus quagga TaxID=89248 RepID=UPI001EE2CB89|nr:translation initiation factor IF-2-like [Equus quagga]XP_046507704.1 translation initiation factor IF-2-like [Equus quagga]
MGKGAPGARRRGPGPGALSCPPWRFPVPEDAAPGARDLSRGAEAPRPTCDRAAFVYGGPAFGRSTGPPRPGEGGGGRGEGPRRGRGRRISPPDPAAAPESQARLRAAVSSDSPRRDPRAPGLEEVAAGVEGGFPERCISQNTLCPPGRKRRRLRQRAVPHQRFQERQSRTSDLSGGGATLVWCPRPSGGGWRDLLASGPRPGPKPGFGSSGSQSGTGAAGGGPSIRLPGRYR